MKEIKNNKKFDHILADVRNDGWNCDVYQDDERYIVFFGKYSPAKRWVSVSVDFKDDSEQNIRKSLGNGLQSQIEAFDPFQNAMKYIRLCVKKKWKRDTICIFKDAFDVEDMLIVLCRVLSPNICLKKRDWNERQKFQYIYQRLTDMCTDLQEKRHSLEDVTGLRESLAPNMDYQIATVAKGHIEEYMRLEGILTVPGLEQVLNIAEEQGWSWEIRQEGKRYYVYLSTYSDAGEDFGVDIDFDVKNAKATFMAELRQSIDDFDPLEHAAMWMEARGRVSGVPDTNMELLEDAESIEERLEDLWDAITDDGVIRKIHSMYPKICYWLDHAPDEKKCQDAEVEIYVELANIKKLIEKYLKEKGVPYGI